MKVYFMPWSGQNEYMIVDLINISISQTNKALNISTYC